MKYLLDTDHISILQRGTGSDFASVMSRIALFSEDDLAVCIVSLHEQSIGCHGYINRAKTDADVVRGYGMLVRVLDAYTSSHVLNFDAAASAKFDDLAARRLRIGVMDLRIAAIALSEGLTLVTRNSSDFGRVDGLKTEDWTK